MRKITYTLWKGKLDENGECNDALLLQEEPVFYTKHSAFKRARALEKKLVYGWDFVILVRKINVDKEECLEWVFGGN